MSLPLVVCVMRTISLVVQAITDFASTGYFRHYLLYKYAFTKKTEMEFATVYTHTLEVPPFYSLFVIILGLELSATTSLRALNTSPPRNCFSLLRRNCSCPP